MVDVRGGSYFGDGATFGNWVEKFTGYGHAAIVDDPNLGLTLELQSRTTGRYRSDARSAGGHRGECRRLRRDGSALDDPSASTTGAEQVGSGMAYPRSQRFLATGATPTMAFGVPDVVRIVQSGANIHVVRHILPP